MKKLIAVILAMICVLQLTSCPRKMEVAEETDEIALKGEITDLSATAAPFWQYADKDTLDGLDKIFNEKKAETDGFADVPSATGMTYYVSSINGDNSAAGTSPETAWKNCYKQI